MRPGVRGGFWALLELRFKETELWKKKEKIRGLWTQIYITKEEKRKGVISPHPRGEDGFTHLALWMFTGFSLAFSGQSRGRR